MRSNKKLSFVLGMLFCTQTLWAAEFEIDTTHSNVGFTAKHLISKVNGEFTDFDGTISFDPKKPDDSKVNAEVRVASITTRNKDRDAHLLGEDFFAEKKFPTLQFVSKKVKSAGKEKFKMTGDLTMRGVTKPVTFDVEFLGETLGPKGDRRVGFVGTTKVNRKDFGINWSKVLDSGGVVVGDEVQININVEGYEKIEVYKSTTAPPDKIG